MPKTHNRGSMKNITVIALLIILSCATAARSERPQPMPSNSGINIQHKSDPNEIYNGTVFSNPAIDTVNEITLEQKKINQMGK